MKKNIFLAVLLFFININISALTYGGCEYSDVSRMKSLVNNVNVYYDYRIENNTAYFDVTLTNIMPGMRFIDSYNDKTYYYSDTNNGEIIITGYDSQSGNYRFYFDNSNCPNVKLGTKYYNFPYYNAYYESSECSDIQEFSLCQKWVNSYYSYDMFHKIVTEYKEKKNIEQIDNETEEDVNGLFDAIIDFYAKYYYLILIPIIAICGLVIIIDRRKSRFKL